MAQVWTIRSLLSWITQDFSTLGLPTARLDGELIIAHTLGYDRVHLYMDLDRPLSAAELASIRALVVRRRKREPIAYLIGKREFYRRDFETTPAVLIPRPDTETLIERALALLPSDAPAQVLDLCTGSGAIAVTLAAERPLLHVDATDLSAEALAVAQRNADKHAVSERVSFRRGDLFDAVPSEQRYALICANPPYITTSDVEQLAPEITQHEPRLALVAGVDGLDVIRRLAAESARFMQPGAHWLCEVGQGQAPAVQALLQAQRVFVEITSHNDLGGIERVVEARVPLA